MMAAMSALAATARASSGRDMKRGTTSAASTPRIITTTMSSMRVKPWARRRLPRAACRRGAEETAANRVSVMFAVDAETRVFIPAFFSQSVLGGFNIGRLKQILPLP